GAAARCAGDPATRGLVIDQARAVATRVDARLIEHTMADFSDSPLAVLLSKLPDCDDGSGAFLERLAGVPAFLASAMDRHRAGIEGLAEEYVQIGGPLFGVRTAGEVHERMRTLRFTTEAEILAVCRAAMDRAEAAAASVLGRLPVHPCGLEPVPALRAASASS